MGYKNGGIVKPLNIILPQTRGFIKYFGNKQRNMSLKMMMM